MEDVNPATANNLSKEDPGISNGTLMFGNPKKSSSVQFFWEVVCEAFSEIGATPDKINYLKLKYYTTESHKLECHCDESVPFKFNVLKDLSNHILRHHCHDTKVCLLCYSNESGCNLSFPNISDASNHATFKHCLSLMMYYMCDECQLILPGVQALKHHLIHAHEESEPDLKLIKKHRCFPCFLCLRPFKTRGSRKSHLRKKHGLLVENSIEFMDKKDEHRNLEEIQLCMESAENFLTQNKLVREILSQWSEKFVKCGSEYVIKEILETSANEVRQAERKVESFISCDRNPAKDGQSKESSGANSNIIEIFGAKMDCQVSKMSYGDVKPANNFMDTTEDRQLDNLMEIDSPLDIPEKNEPAKNRIADSDSNNRDSPTLSSPCSKSSRAMIVQGITNHVNLNQNSSPVDHIQTCHSQRLPVNVSSEGLAIPGEEVLGQVQFRKPGQSQESNLNESGKKQSLENEIHIPVMCLETNIMKEASSQGLTPTTNNREAVDENKADKFESLAIGTDSKTSKKEDNNQLGRIKHFGIETSTRLCKKPKEVILLKKYPRVYLLDIFGMNPSKFNVRDVHF